MKTRLIVSGFLGAATTLTLFLGVPFYPIYDLMTLPMQALLKLLYPSYMGSFYPSSILYSCLALESLLISGAYFGIACLVLATMKKGVDSPRHEIAPGKWLADMPRSVNHDRVVKACRTALARERNVGFAELEPREKELIATLLMHEEIRNGGFAQWFTNSHGDYADYAIRFLERVGAHERLRLIAMASAVFPSGKIPPTWQERRTCASHWTKDDFRKFDPIDTAYYAIDRDIYDDMVTLVSDTVN
jgi:hypothetical protein